VDLDGERAMDFNDFVHVTRNHTYTPTHAYKSIYIYVCV